MSFPKAKLQRFNDVHDSTPSPADYNPTVKGRIHGTVISQSDRFADQIQSPAPSDTSVRSAYSSGCFRTPTALKKKKQRMNMSTSKANNESLCQTSVDVEALQEKIVECNNKDVYINEITEQLEEMKLHVSNVQKENQQLMEEKNTSDDKIEELIQQYYYQHKTLLLEINSGEIMKERSEFKSIEDLDFLYKAILKAYQDEISQKKDELKEMMINFSKLEESHLAETEDYKKKYKDDLRIIEADMLKIITSLEKKLENEKIIVANKKLEISQLQQKLKEEKLKLQHECEQQKKQIKEDCNEARLLVEIQMEEKCKDIESTWQVKLKEQEKEAQEILKECQAISEYNIIQCEIEKNTALNKLALTTEELENIKKEVEEMSCLKLQMDSNYQILKNRYDTVVSEFNSLREQTQQDKQIWETSLQQAETDKHLYEVTITKTRDTIETLTKRLFDSDRDVEQLKIELENTECSKLLLEATCNQLSDELENAKKINEDLEMQNESNLKLTQDNIKEIETKILQKIDQDIQAAKESVKAANYKFDQKCSELEDVLEQLHHQQELNLTAQSLVENARIEIEKLEAENIDLKSKLLLLQTEKQEADQARDCLQIKIDQMDTEKYEKLMEKYQELVQKNSELEKKVAEQESLIGPFREQLENYELECGMLIHQKSNAEAETEAIATKYAELIGHHNQKQKIKHMYDLKGKLNKLNEINAQLEKKVRSQAKVIEKLKNSNAGKENRQTVNISSSFTSSPLRERN